MERRTRRPAGAVHIECPACHTVVTFDRRKIVPGPHAASIPCASCARAVPIHSGPVLRAPQFPEERDHDHLAAGHGLRIVVEANGAQQQTVVVLYGQLDVLSAPDAAACLNGLLDGAADVVVDLARVDFIDSVGLLTLFEARIRARRVGRNVTLQHPSGHVARVLAVARLHDGTGREQ